MRYRSFTRLCTVKSELKRLNFFTLSTFNTCIIIVSMLAELAKSVAFSSLIQCMHFDKFDVLFKSLFNKLTKYQITCFFGLSI